jgi:Ni,Fe-hydrogenase III component G
MHAEISPAQLLLVCRRVREEGGRLVSLWGEDRGEGSAAYRLCVVLDTATCLRVIECPIHSEAPTYPDLSGICPSAARLQRATFDLLGLRAMGGDERPWLRHSGWPADYFPLRAGAEPAPAEAARKPYPFVRVEGDGVHEIAVGPVHAGTIEPGHFRFSVVAKKYFAEALVVMCTRASRGASKA